MIKVRGSHFEQVWIKRKQVKQSCIIEQEKQRGKWVMLLNERNWQISHVAKQEEIAKELNNQKRGSRANKLCYQMRGSSKWVTSLIERKQVANKSCHWMRGRNKWVTSLNERKWQMSHIIKWEEVANKFYHQTRWSRKRITASNVEAGQWFTLLSTRKWQTSHIKEVTNKSCHWMGGSIQ